MLRLSCPRTLWSITVPSLNRLHLERAVRALRGGGVIAHATEGVWGLACDPANQRAVARVVQLKGRRADQGFILVAGSIEQVRPMLDRLECSRREAVLRSWPGPVTWIVPAGPEVPKWIVGRHRGVAVRVSDHYQIVALCLMFGGPLLSTSANLHGRPPARSALAARRSFRRGIQYLLPGELGGRQQPSAILDASSGRVLRPG